MRLDSMCLRYPSREKLNESIQNECPKTNIKRRRDLMIYTVAEEKKILKSALIKLSERFMNS